MCHFPFPSLGGVPEGRGGQILELEKIMKKLVTFFIFLIALGLITACSPKVGSPEWCEKIKEKDKGDLTVNEAKDFAKHCIFK
jgi:hypothetical protein